MNGGDADMMEADVTSPPPPPPDPISDPNAARNWLLTARQLLHQGKPSQALQAVVMAMKIQGDEGSVAEALNRAREKYVNKIQTNAAADQLASLFAECAIAEATTTTPSFQQPQSQHYNNNNNINNNEGTTSILAESGRNQIVLDASSDGSSFVCLQCGGLVSNLRKDEHFAFWCSQT
ncbi:hypothetical protein ABFS82_03G040100 [Erythranthe guttata]|nr:PREDICTED: uncharacterized protein LOC105971440 [Erythranthe guttata]|eukprot:XP_012851748.1 PREDICTED: uncharacterized protein LOC105971440 [Erythranthe guttata]